MTDTILHRVESKWKASGEQLFRRARTDCAGSAFSSAVPTLRGVRICFSRPAKDIYLHTIMYFYTFLRISNISISLSGCSAGVMFLSPRCGLLYIYTYIHLILIIMPVLLQYIYIYIYIYYYYNYYYVIISIVILHHKYHMT